MNSTTVWFNTVWLTAVVELNEAETGTVISTSKGKVSGWERISRGGRIFQGWTKIPYAQPPINDLRLMPPLPPEKWRGILNATEDAPACIQNANPIMIMGSSTVSEDCLYLNVYRPKNHSLKYMPVLVYIHGGSFIGGSVGGRPSADYLMDEDIVFVQMNYRVNVFGFMSLNDDVLPGNYGMKDQVRALEWIKNNIKAFSGDPKNIVVFGESAGGASAHLLLKSPLSKDLINGAVSHSGTINPIWSLIKGEYVKELTLEVSNIVGCKQSSSAEILKCLQDVDGQKLLQAFNKVNKLPIRRGFAPVVEPKTVKRAFATEDLSLTPTDKPWINTFVNGEYVVIAKMLGRYNNIAAEISKNVSAFLQGIMSPESDQAQKDLGVDILDVMYFKEMNATTENLMLVIAKVFGDECFTYPAMVTTQSHSGPKWLGLLEYPPDKMDSGEEEVASHGLNIIFYFNLTNGVSETPSPQFVDTSKRMIKYLVNFAYYSDPTPPGSPFIWPQFNTFEILRTTRKGDAVGDQSTFNHYQKLKHAWEVVHGWK